MCIGFMIPKECVDGIHHSWHMNSVPVPTQCPVVLHIGSGI